VTVRSITFAPPYSVVVIDDPANKIIPAWVDGPVVSGTDSCLLVSCMAEVDGETEFTLGNVKEVNPAAHLVFRGVLDTPNLRIVLGTAEGKTILESPTLGRRTKVWIWANSLSRPDKVVVGIE
jgi:hypothetical protein